MQVNIIDSLISLAEPIRVKAKWDKLPTENGVTVSRLNLCLLFSMTVIQLLGAAAPLDFCALDSRSPILYPPALLRQLGKDDCAKFDIECTFNSEVNWNTDPQKNSLAAGETDLTSVVLHEFMHGIPIFL